VLGTLALVLLMLIFAALFEYRVVKRMVEKISRLGRGALKFREGELEHRISVRGNDEFAMLARLFNRMAMDIGASQRELEQFAYVASHDLQEPLRMVNSYTQLLAKRYEGKLDERADKYIHYAVDGATRMQTLINDLLTYSRINASPKALTRVSTQSLFNDAITDLSIAIEEANAEVKVDGELPEVLGDDVQLKQVFQNLISNAIKYNESTTPQVVISAKQKQKVWEIAVADNGIGIPKEARQRAFQIFQRLHEREKYTGTGLGLAIVKKVIDQHQGSIRIESNEPCGSIFIFTLPVFERHD
jgi:light-regulated signal transduction histidine kinase (bacteriophytochrome)